MTDERRAIVDRREQIKAEPRPGKMHETPEVEETPDVWLVYWPEWLNKDVHYKRERVEQTYRERYEGRVEPEDMRIIEFGNMFALELFLPNVKGQFKTWELADEFVGTHLPPEGVPWVKIVARNSREDHLIQEYGKKMLVKKDANRS